MTVLPLERLLPARIDDAALPLRVQAEIRREQQRGDILAGSVQMALCAVFALLYLFARKTYPADAPFVPVPWALAAYSLFTALRLAMAWQARLPGWMQLLSIAVDMTLLLGLIWSFHLQYRQVPAFYLKAPTLLYVFITPRILTDTDFYDARLLTRGPLERTGLAPDLPSLKPSPMRLIDPATDAPEPPPLPGTVHRMRPEDGH